MGCKGKMKKKIGVLIVLVFIVVAFSFAYKKHELVKDVLEDNPSNEESSKLALDFLESISGEYEYVNEFGEKGRLIIKPNEYGEYDIYDYIEGDNYRFLASSSDIQDYEDGCLNIMYPESVYEDESQNVYSYYDIAKWDDRKGIFVYKKSKKYPYRRYLLYSAMDKKIISSKTTQIDFDSLGVEPYSYTTSDKFELSEAQKGAILLLCGKYFDWSVSDVYEDDWTEFFESAFLQNKVDYGCDYFNRISEKEGKVTKEEAEYILYSLTGEMISSSIKKEEPVEIRDWFVHDEMEMEDCSIEEEGDTVVIHATVWNSHVSYDKSIGEVICSTDRKVEVVLKKNPYSCFDGYSIARITDMELQ